MRYTYLDYLIENPKLYKQAIGVSTFVIFLSLIIIFTTYLNPGPDKDLDHSELAVGLVQGVKQIEVKRKGRALFDFNREVDDNALLIKIENIEFIIEGRIYLDYYNKFISLIKQGDFLKVYYFIDFEGNKIVQQIEKNDKILMPIEYTWHRFSVIKVAFLSSFSFFLLVVIILYIKRRIYLNTSIKS